MNRPRITCQNGASLSVQASDFHYCWPRTSEFSDWRDYSRVEVGFIENADTPESFRPYADGDIFPSDVYGYVPTKLVEDFLFKNGGEKN